MDGRQAGGGDEQRCVRWSENNPKLKRSWQSGRSAAQWRGVNGDGSGEWDRKDRHRDSETGWFIPVMSDHVRSLCWAVVTCSSWQWAVIPQLKNSAAMKSSSRERRAQTEKLNPQQRPPALYVSSMLVWYQKCYRTRMIASFSADDILLSRGRWPGGRHRGAAGGASLKPSTLQQTDPPRN